MGWFIDWHDPEVPVLMQIWHLMFRQQSADRRDMWIAYWERWNLRVRPVYAARIASLDAYRAAVRARARQLLRGGWPCDAAFEQAESEILPWR